MATLMCLFRRLRRRCQKLQMITYHMHVEFCPAVKGAFNYDTPGSQRKILIIQGTLMQLICNID